MITGNVGLFNLLKFLLLIGALLAPTGKARAEQAAEKVELREIRAIVTHIVGDAFAKLPDGQRISVRRFLVLRDDTLLELKPDTTLTVACVSGVILKIEQSGPLGVEQCLHGKRELGSSRGAAKAAARAAAALASSRGRVSLWRNSPALEGETRTGEGYYGNRPVLLSPSCVNEMSKRLGCPLLVAAPREIRWTMVKGASHYVVSLDGFDDLRVEAAACRDEAHFEQAVCSRPWPEGWRVRPGKKYFLSVTATIDLFEKAASKKTKIELLNQNEATDIRAQAEAVDALGLDAEARGLLLASLFAELRLFNAAVEILEEMTRETSDPVFHLALGDAYVRVGLLHPALRRYENVLKQLDATAEHGEVRAAAEFGLGWVHLLDDRSKPALAHFRSAKKLSAREPLIRQACRMIKMLKRAK